MNLIEKAERIMEHYICDNCLGRQFGQLLSGYDNSHRGRVIRSLVAMSIDKEGKESMNMDMMNFTGFRFHFLEIDIHKLKAAIAGRKCHVCENIFDRLDRYAAKIENTLKKIEFKTFLIGTKLSHELNEREEQLWEHVGIDYCEPIKAEINRELGKTLEKRTRKKFSVKNPDVVILLDMASDKVELQINPIFIYGMYQKLVRGIPQTKWPDKKYKTSVEEIIAKPFMAVTKATGHKLHGFGREDIDARCLGWRPFVLELLEPKKRLEKESMLRLARKIGKQVRVKGIRFSNIAEVRMIKEAKGDKTYKALVVCDNIIKKEELKKISSLKGEIRQRTPQRVIHRRADMLRKRKVFSIKTKQKGKKSFILTVRTEGGLYIKELISGDNGRTQPSISSILQNSCKCKELDVMAVHYKG